MSGSVSHNNSVKTYLEHDDPVRFQRDLCSLSTTRILRIHCILFFSCTKLVEPTHADRGKLGFYLFRVVRR